MRATFTVVHGSADSRIAACRMHRVLQPSDARGAATMNLLALPSWLLWPLAHLAAVLALVAGALLALGFFSARRGWEPRCRRCAHDLR